MNVRIRPILLIAATLLPSASLADLYVGTSAGAQACINGLTPYFHCEGPIYGVEAASASISDSDLGSFNVYVAWATANAFGAAGLLRIGVDIGREMLNPLGPSVQLLSSAGGFARFVDRATVVSAGPGPVVLKLSFPLTYVITRLPAGTYHNIGSGNISIGFYINGTPVSDGQEIQIAAGSDVSIDGRLEAYVAHSTDLGGAIPAYRPEAGMFQDRLAIDAMHSANFYLDVLTPGASLVAESGHDYSSPQAIPEPRTSSLMLIALASLCPLFRIRGRRR